MARRQLPSDEGGSSWRGRRNLGQKDGKRDTQVAWVTPAWCCVLKECERGKETGEPSPACTRVDDGEYWFGTSRHPRLKLGLLLSGLPEKRGVVPALNVIDGEPIIAG